MATHMMTMSMEMPVLMTALRGKVAMSRFVIIAFKCWQSCLAFTVWQQ